MAETTMRRQFLTLSVLAAMAGAGCEGRHTSPLTPAAHEQAKADCAEHGGLVHAEYISSVLRENRTEATCTNGVRITREFLSPPKAETP